MELNGSDHLPVLADFSIEIEHEARPVVQAHYFARQDAAHNDNIPHFRTNTRQITFAHALPLVAQQQMLTLHNDSDAPVCVSLALLAVPWLELEPRQVTIDAHAHATLLLTATPPVDDDAGVEHVDVDDDADVDVPGKVDTTILVLRAGTPNNNNTTTTTSYPHPHPNN
jgi:hypothetical protein